jgi:hypothetical protein
MGLDGVELVVSIEEAFNIELTDAEAQEIRTAQQLCDLVARKVNAIDPKLCHTQQAFLVMHDSDLIVPPGTALSLEQVRLKVRDIVAEALGIRRTSMTTPIS